MSNTIEYSMYTDCGEVTIGGDTPVEFEANMSDVVGYVAYNRIMDALMRELGVTSEQTERAAVQNLADAGMVPQPPPQAAYQPPQAAYQPPQSQPQPQPQAQAAPTCQHGAKQFKQDKYNTPPEWQAWMCPADRNDPTRCKPVYL